MFVFFLGLGRYVEMIARHRAGSVADALARLAPATARRVQSGVAEDVQAVELAIGDELVVRSGEVLAADGLVIEGDGRVDESMLTGESAAVSKPPGTRVHQGTHNLGAPLRVRVTAVAGDTVLAGIVALLERAQAERPRLARAADRAAAWFLSRILVGAAVVFAVWWYVDPSRAFSATLAVLVVTCPCALSLATPTALAAATAALARRGILVAHTDAIETLSKATHVLWDKTGTLTRGLVRIEDVHTFGEVTAAQAMSWAGALEQLSEHPIARAFAASGATAGRASEVEVHAGQGIDGRLGGRRLRIGTREFAAALHSATPAGGPAQVPGDGSGESWIYLGDDSGLLAAFRLTDPLRPEAQDCVANLAALGLPSEIVSGDETSAVARIAARCGIERHSARLAPQDKLERLKALQAGGAVVVAVGDGINDAPLLRGADVAIAMGRGSALAQNSADLILVRESLEDLPRTIDLARRTQRVVHQNLAWSIAYNLAALPLAALGYVPPWLAAIGMSLSSVVVVLNAMRLSRGSTPQRRPQWPAAREAEVA
jgi:Cu2+-exporting ATPase